MNVAMRAGAESQIFWNDNNAFKTYFFDSFSIIIPSGERLVVDAVNSALESLDNLEPYMEEAKRLVTEEQHHSIAHKKYNHRLAALGYPVASLESKISQGVDELLILKPKEKLVIAAAFEYITVIISKTVLKSDRWITAKNNFHANTWRWHCKEEIGHASVSEDMLKAINVSYFKRLSIFLAMSFILLSDLFVSIYKLYSADITKGTITRRKFIVDAMSFFTLNFIDFIYLLIKWLRYCLPRL